MIMLIFQFIIIPIIMNNFHPLNMMILFMLFTMSILMLNYLNYNITLYLLMIFISIIGGIMIMFLYFTSLINNYKMKMNNKEKFLIMMLSIFNTMILFMFIKSNIPIEESKFLIKIYNIYLIYTYPYNLMTYLSIIYLFYSLTLIMKMCSFKFKPMRKMKN
uniref:NADH dehydrogenase subunit 6 n=1 Tax=Hylaeus dilatatus TaxID=1542591 RepID=A0A0U1YWA5_9HYME|nr:NADH dehydrogenase subunit 6 [Hylaeus dilatatus]AJG02937.1 NADH dehydrogenase subunit 6 [Hylaeus dilatatus]